jgi:hypothetical protein
MANFTQGHFNPLRFPLALALDRRMFANNNGSYRMA